METRFTEFKNEILIREKEANACRLEYGRAYKSETFIELMQVIKDNFEFATRNKVIEPIIIEAYKDEFNANGIYCNVDCTSGFLLVCGSATVRAYDSATVRAYDSTTVKAYDSTTVEARGSATVRAYDSAYVTSYHTIGCRLYNNAIYRIGESNTIRYTSGDIKFERERK